ncbi:MAG TPA: hypothetical protein VHM00_04960 [Caldimonas sp.]|nr:hypothetical protein [Caldimonas sp.]HEX2540414.1 hypothetical protein [Caldimonas sp.]
MIEKIFAAGVVLGCVVLLLRVLLGPRRRSRLDAAVRRTATLLQHRFGRFVGLPSAHARAEREARNAIARARARASADREGNVIRPKAFKRKKRDLH